ncbi:proline-rich protein PRCC [Bombus flavifrons]|uniref:proline-rich protein PRCC n=1 Tax=Bombus flavifrons TaxID=103934 RepID=UPI003703EB81
MNDNSFHVKMSLVAYGSSDESSDDERSNCNTEIENRVTPEVTVLHTNHKLYLPTSEHSIFAEKDGENSINIEIPKTSASLEKIHFDKLPKPKSMITEAKDVTEEDDIPLKKEIEFKSERPIKRNRVPVKITVPSLSEFKDVAKENEFKSNKVESSNKGSKLLVLLPPPKGTEVRSTNNLVPSVINKVVKESSQITVQPSKDTYTKNSNSRKLIKPITTKSSISITYDSNSDDEDDTTIGSDSNSVTDFFALTTANTVSSSTLPDSLNVDVELNNFDLEFKNNSKEDNNLPNCSTGNSDIVVTEMSINKSQKTLVSNVINLPREEILLKNKTEIGPKLPLPEQEYNVDSEGNVAFDDKAIEYLCGKRGVKRKSKEIEEINIIEINGEDIKPDEREWLVKALTEEPVQRPISMQGGGVSSQSKKKHQITYLAHQAKAMEMELKNQWAQNRLTRKQTQSKYGF